MDWIDLLRRRTLVFPLACAAALSMLFISESSYWQSARALDSVVALDGVRNSVLSLQQGILDAETSQRGYLLTGRTEHLQPYREALATIDASFALLDRHYAGQPEPQALLDRLHALVAARSAQLALSIRDRAAIPGEARGDVAVGDASRRQMTDIRAHAGELLAFGATRVSTLRQGLHDTLSVARIGVATLSLFSLVALGLYLRQTAALKREHWALKRSVQDERDRLEVEVRSRTAQLTELAHHLQTAREDERHRLARNLHDELGALLTSAKLDAARIRSRLAGTAPEALERLAHLVQTLDASIALGRSIIEDLRPSTLANLGLVPTLEILAREFGERSGVKVACTLTPVTLDASAELTVYRLVQEAITNISKHARARQVWLTMAEHDGVVEVTVRDDGVGFDASVPPQSAYGLVGMRFRVEAARGRLVVDSKPGQGTRLRLTMPVSGAPSPPHAG
jgi:signal transduction histidine kinase